MGAGTYAYLDVDARSGQVDALGADAIKVGMIYKPASVTPVGTTAVLNSAAFVNGGDPDGRATARRSPRRSRRTRAASAFVFNVNHLKSKGSACSVPDAGDGQGNCNQVRLNAVNALTSWLASDPTGTGDPDVLLVGDYNSYAMEDPITALQNGSGFVHLIKARLGADAYSYVFDGQWGYLDHALASASLDAQVAGCRGLPHQRRRAVGAGLQHQLQVRRRRSPRSMPRMSTASPTTTPSWSDSPSPRR
jgi:predicted extracellular nuclease